MNNILKKHRVKYFINIILSIISSILFARFAIGLGSVIDVVVTKEGNLVDKIIYCVLIILAWFVISILFSFFKSKYASNIINDLKSKLYCAIGRKEISDYMSATNEYYLNNMTKNIDFYNDNYLGPKCDIFANLISAFVSVGAIFFISWKLALSFVGVSLITIILSQLPGIIMSKATTKFSNKNAENLKLINNNLKGFEQIKLLGVFSGFYKNYLIEDAKFENVRFEYMFALRLANTLGIFFSFFAQLACMSIGIYFVLRGDLTVGLLISSINLLNGVFGPIQEFAQNRNLMKTVDDIKNNFDSILNTSEESGRVLKNKIDEISVNNIKMSFEDKTIFDNYSVKFNSGNKYAIVGESGRGKSTLVKLIMKYYVRDKYSGDIFINNENIDSFKTSDLYSKIAYIQRNDFYVNGSIKNNIDLFRQIEIKDELIENLKLTNKFLDKQIEEGSRNQVSSGEKQRIDIARFLVQDYDVLIFDEPTSNLDFETSKMIFDLIFKIQNKIVIVITHTDDKEILGRFDEIIKL